MPRRVIHASGHPPDRASNFVGRRIGEQNQDGGVGECADDHTGHQQRPRVTNATDGARDPEHEQHGNDRTAERRQRHETGAGDTERERDHCTNRRAAGHAEQIRFGQRIAQGALQRGATAAERAPNQHREHQSWQSQVENNRLRERIASSTERAQHISGGNRHRADRQRRHHQRHQQHTERGPQHRRTTVRLGHDQPNECDCRVIARRRG